MIKGILALFRSKAIWNPKTLLGIIAASYVWSHIEKTREAFNCFSDSNTYIVLAAIIVVTKCFFLGKYKRKKHFDLSNFFVDSIIALLHVVAVMFLTLSFGLSMSIG